MRRLIIGILVIAAVVAGGSLIANIAYQAGLSTAVTTVAQTAPDGSVVVPVVPGAYPGYGYGYGIGGHGPFGYGPGFSFFGFLGTLLIIVVIIGLLRAAFFRGSRHGWGGPGRGWGDKGPGERPWERHARDTFETWHRESHEPGSPPAGSPPAGSPPAGSTPAGS